MAKAHKYQGKHFKRPEDYLPRQDSPARFGAQQPQESQQTHRDSELARSQGSPSVGRSTATMSLATLLSRITGFGRTWAMAFALGSTALTSTYVVANNVPNQLYELVAGGVLTTAFLPIYLAQLKRHGQKRAANYTSNILTLAGIALGLVALIAAIFAPQVISLQTFLASDFDLDRAALFFRFFAIQIVFYGVGAIISGMLNAHRSFLWPALGPVFNNIVVIITFIAYPFIAATNDKFAMIWLCVGTTLGVAALFAVQLPALVKLKVPLKLRIDFKDQALGDTFRLAGPAILFVIMGVLTVMAMNNFATATVADGPATLQFAQLWYFLPYGVIAVALSTALLTEMSEASALHDWDGFRSNVRMGLRTTLFLILPLAAIIWCMSDQFAALFNFGAFTDDDAQNVSAILAVWCLALPFYAAYMFIYRVFSAMRNLKRFVAIDSIGRVLLILLYGAFAMGFGVVPSFGLIGIPMAEIVVNIALCSVMLYQLRKKIGTFGLTQIVIDGLKLLVAAVVAVALPYVALLYFAPAGPAWGFASIVVLGLFALVVYYLLCRVLRIPELVFVHRLANKIKVMVAR